MITSIYLAFPPFLVLTISFWLALRSNKKNLINANKQLSIFLIGIIGLNTIEFLTYSGILNPSLILMKLYYVFMIVILSSVLMLSIKICNLKVILNFQRETSILLFIVTTIFTFFILSTDLLIQNIRLTNYSLTRVPGEYYFLIKYLFVALAIPILGFLIIGSSQKEVNDNVKRARVILLSFSPLLISLLCVLTLMEMGFQINASIILPIGSAILLTVIINTERREDLFKLLIKIPYTAENINFKRITNEVESFLASAKCGEQASLKGLTSQLEKLIVSMAVEMANGSQVKAAELLNTSTSSICRKIRV